MQEDEARSLLYSLCEGPIFSDTLRELRLVLREHGNLSNSTDYDDWAYESHTPFEDCIESFMWDESEERFEAVKMIVDAGAKSDEWYDD